MSLSTLSDSCMRRGYAETEPPLRTLVFRRGSHHVSSPSIYDGNRWDAYLRFALGIWIILGLSLLAPNVVCAGETLDRVLTKKTMVVIVEPGYPPFSFLNKQNQIEGFDVDVAKAVANRLGVTLRIDTPSCEIMNAGNWNGRWDVCICSMTPDRRKAKVLDFVVPYYQSSVVVVTTAANKTLKSASDLTGKRIGVEHGSTYERYLQHDLDLNAAGPKITYAFDWVNIIPYGSEDLAYHDLALGAGRRVDAVISNHGSAKYRMNKSPHAFRIVGHPLYTEPNWIAVDKGDAEWQQKIREIIHDLKADGTLARISRKWLEEDVTR